MKSLVTVLLAIIVVPLIPFAARADCDCQSGSGVVHGPAVAQSPAAVVPGPVARPLPDAAPPPGTLGVTYARASHPIPEDEHPRTAMLAVRDLETVPYLRVQRMSGFRMQNNVWLFESQRPLFPGQDHVVRVEARNDKADIQPCKVKFVRLSP